MTMEMFLEELCTAVKNTAVKENLTIGTTAIDNDQLTVNIKTGNGTRGCINTHRFIFWPSDEHEMMIEEIWIGYDEEGYPWSDHMGGLTVGCNGLKVKDAINKLVNSFIEKATK